MGNFPFRSCCVPTYAEISSDVSEEYAPSYNDFDLEQSERVIIHSGSSGYLIPAQGPSKVKHSSGIFKSNVSNLDVHQGPDVTGAKPGHSKSNKSSIKSTKRKSRSSAKPTVSFITKKTEIPCDSNSQTCASDSGAVNKSCDSETSSEEVVSKSSTVSEENICGNLLAHIFTAGPMCNVTGDVSEDEPRLQPQILELLKCNAEDETLNFPFLTSLESVEFISNSKFFFIMRGLSGSGKSYLAKALQSIYHNSIICSADEYFWHDGQYEFNREGLQYAHKYCQERAYRACQGGVSVIIIDNTNIKYWEMKPYVKMAQEFCYIVLVVSPKTKWSTDTGALSKLNKHNVDTETIQRKLVDYMRPTSPRYFGWFLNDEAAELLKMNSTLWLSRAYNLPKFLDDFNLDLCGYFQEVPYKMHCTARFCGDKSSRAVQDYARDPLVTSSFGKVFLLHVVGFFMTEDCWGAIVNLDDDQLKLYSTRDLILPSGIQDLDTSGCRPGVRAHITIGTRPSVQHVKCGLDLVQLANLHVKGGPKDVSFVSGGVLVRYSHRVWGMFPSCHLHINACFAGGY